MSDTCHEKHFSPSGVLQEEVTPSFPCRSASDGNKVVGSSVARGLMLTDIHHSMKIARSGEGFPDSTALRLRTRSFQIQTQGQSRRAKVSDFDPIGCYRSLKSGMCMKIPAALSGMAGPLRWCEKRNTITMKGMASAEDSMKCKGNQQVLLNHFSSPRNEERTECHTMR